MAGPGSARHRATAWATLLALLAALLLPTVVRAAPGAPGATWAEVCTVQGTRLVAVAADGPGFSLHGAWEHCPWCLAHAAAPPPAPAGRPEPWAGEEPHPGGHEAADQARPVHRALPPPRGPPGPVRG